MTERSNDADEEMAQQDEQNLSADFYRFFAVMLMSVRGSKARSEGAYEHT